MSDSKYQVELDEIRDECELTAGFELLAQMIEIEVEADSYTVTTTPRSRQELIAALGNKKTIDKRTKAFVNEFGVVEDMTGAFFDDRDDFERVYRIRPDALRDETLKEIKKKGWIRRHEDAENVPNEAHANVHGGSSHFGRLPDFEAFVDENLRD